MIQNYLREVLGIREWLAVEDSKSSGPESCLFIRVSGNPTPGDEEVLSRMRMALELPEDQWRILGPSQITPEGCVEVALLLDVEGAGSNAKLPSDLPQQTFVSSQNDTRWLTYSLAAMRAQPMLKKKVWIDLQAARAKLSQIDKGVNRV